MHQLKCITHPTNILSKQDIINFIQTVLISYRLSCRKAQELATFCWFPLSLNNPFVDRGNGHWNFQTGLTDYAFELIPFLSCISFSFSLQSLRSTKTCLLSFRKNFETVDFSTVLPTQLLSHSQQMPQTYFAASCRLFSSLLPQSVLLFLKNVSIVWLPIHFSFAEVPFVGDKVLNVLWHDWQPKQMMFGDVHWCESRT